MITTSKQITLAAAGGFIGLALLAAPAFAYSQAVINACTGDYLAHCSAYDENSAQGERCIIEPEFPENGFYMFHAHQSAMADRGWMGWFNVAGTADEAARQLAGFKQGNYADALSSCRPCIGTLGAKAITVY